MSEDIRQYLQECAASYGIAVSDGQAEQFQWYMELLIEWNQKMNLTAITEPKAVVVKHFLDSILLLPELEQGDTLIDVGTGAGFPGVVAKLYRPEIDLTLMEPTGKRVEFLRRLCERLDITADVVKERAEEAARKQWRETFDVATARAVAALPALAEYCLPLVKVGGWFITMKGANAEEEMESAAGAVKKLGAVLEKELSFVLPDNSLRSLIFYRKVSPTPPAYPRNGGKIAKAPLR